MVDKKKVKRGSAKQPDVFTSRRKEIKKTRAAVNVFWTIIRVSWLHVYQILTGIFWWTAHALDFIIFVPDTEADIDSGSKTAAEKKKKFDPSQFLVERQLEIPKLAGVEPILTFIEKKMFAPIRNPEAARKLNYQGGGGVFLFGPKGVGKTSVARWVAARLGFPFLLVRQSYFSGGGNPEQNVMDFFSYLRTEFSNVVVFIDECSELMRSRRSQGHSGRRGVTNQLLEEWDGLVKGQNNILIITATTRPEIIDDDFLRTGRLDVRVYVGLPSRKARVAIVKRELKGIKLDSEINLEDIGRITTGFSGADMVGLANAAKDGPMQRSDSTPAEELKITVEDFSKAMRIARSSVSAQRLEEFREYAGRFQAFAPEDLTFGDQEAVTKFNADQALDAEKEER